MSAGHAKQPPAAACENPIRWINTHRTRCKEARLHGPELVFAPEAVGHGPSLRVAPRQEASVVPNARARAAIADLPPEPPPAVVDMHTRGQSPRFLRWTARTAAGLVLPVMVVLPSSCRGSVTATHKLYKACATLAGVTASHAIPTARVVENQEIRPAGRASSPCPSPGCIWICHCRSLCHMGFAVEAATAVGDYVHKLRSVHQP